MTEEEFLVHLVGLLAVALILGLPAVIYGIRLLRRERSDGFIVADTALRFGFDPMPEPVTGPLARQLLRWKYRSGNGRSRHTPVETDATS